MQEGPSEKVRSHSLMAKIFHWGFIIVFIYALSKQVDNVGQLADVALLRFEIVFAIGFLILLAVRYVYMRMTRPTALPENTSSRMKMLAKMGHLAMYISLAMIAVSGLLIGAIFSTGGAEGAGMGFAIALHEISIFASLASIGLHIAAALYHRFKGDGIWTSMVPIWKERND